MDSTHCNEINANKSEVDVEPPSEPVQVEVNVRGFRTFADPLLSDAGKGKEKWGSEHNDWWATNHANSHRMAVNWDASV